MKLIKKRVTDKGDKFLLDEIRQGNEDALTTIYMQHREEFLSWAKKKYQLSPDSAADFFQDAILICYENIRNKKLTELTSSFKTYIFAIAKNLILNSFDKPEFSDLDSSEKTNELKNEISNKMQHEERQNLVDELLERVGEPCKSILKMFYFQGFSMETIASRLKYKNDNVVKSTKIRCIKELKEKIRKFYNQDDF